MVDTADGERFSSTVVPYLHVAGGATALEYYTAAFGATEVFRMTDENGLISHASFTIGDASFNLSDEWPEKGLQSPNTLGGHSVSLVLTVEDAEAFIERLTRFGVQIERELDDTEPGWHGGWVIDPYGHRWLIMSEKPEPDDR